MFEEPDGSHIFTVDRQVYSKYTSSPLNEELPTRFGGKDNYGFYSEFMFPNKFDNKDVQSNRREYAETIENNNQVRTSSSKNLNVSNRILDRTYAQRRNEDSYINKDILEWSKGETQSETTAVKKKDKKMTSENNSKSSNRVNVKYKVRIGKWRNDY